MGSASESRAVILSREDPPVGAQAAADEVISRDPPSQEGLSAQRLPASEQLLHWDDLLGMR